MSTVGNSLLATFVIDLGVQFVFYIGSAIAKSELLYDFSGSLTYIACILSALLWRQDVQNLSNLSSRQVIAAIGVLVWCSRLGIMLFTRILRVGEDKRFEKLKGNPLTFAIPWSMQVIWIFLTALPVYIVLGNPASTQPSFGASDGVGLAIWIFGFSVEAIADNQKNAFKNAHPNDFVSTGI